MVAFMSLPSVMSVWKANADDLSRQSAEETKHLYGFDPARNLKT